MQTQIKSQIVSSPLLVSIEVGLRGAIKLSYNPTKAERDRLYRARVNPVVNFAGQGVTLFGDKTALINQVRLIELM